MYRGEVPLVDNEWVAVEVRRSLCSHRKMTEAPGPPMIPVVIQVWIRRWSICGCRPVETKSPIEPTADAPDASSYVLAKENFGTG